ncbi:MAG: Ldh family oxidoreductase, partial [Proteobacteria bacterium]|nr:Ldh family oxidoreductase [Pseudomonadota bacterium]
GQSVGTQAVELGLRKAQKNGVAIVALRNAGHLGRIGDWAEMAVAAGLVSIHFVNVAGSLLVAPFGGTERRMSTNPFCVGVPVAGGPPLILDFATSVVAEGKVLVAASGGKPLPPGSLIGADGELSTDPRTLYGTGDPHDPVGGRLGEGAMCGMGEHKGSGLALICEMLAGALTGSGCAGPAKRRIANGMLSIYLSLEAFTGDHDFAAEARRYLDFFTSARPAVAGGEVLVPGQPEQRNRTQRLAEGIEVPGDAWADIRAAALDAGLSQARIDAATEA